MGIVELYALGALVPAGHVGESGGEDVLDLRYNTVRDRTFEEWLRCDTERTQLLQRIPYIHGWKCRRRCYLHLHLRLHRRRRGRRRLDVESHDWGTTTDRDKQLLRQQSDVHFGVQKRKSHSLFFTFLRFFNRHFSLSAIELSGNCYGFIYCRFRLV